MSIHVLPDLLKAEARLVPAPGQRSCEDHNFELPTGLYVMMAGLLFGFLAVLAIGLASPGLVVPMAINAIFLTAFFSIPAIFVRTARDANGPKSWQRLLERGVETETGHCSGAEAIVLSLLLPAFIFLWAIAVVTIAALV